MVNNLLSRRNCHRGSVRKIEQIFKTVVFREHDFKTMLSAPAKL